MTWSWTWKLSGNDNWYISRHKASPVVSMPAAKWSMHSAAIWIGLNASLLFWSLYVKLCASGSAFALEPSTYWLAIGAGLGLKTFSSQNDKVGQRYWAKFPVTASATKSNNGSNPPTFKAVVVCQLFHYLQIWSVNRFCSVRSKEVMGSTVQCKAVQIDLELLTLLLKTELIFGLT